MSDLNTHKPLLRFIDYSGNWINNKLKNLCVVNQGLQIPIAERLKEPTPTAKPYITIQFLNNSKEAEYVENPSDSVICNEDDILMTRTGNTGIVVSNVNGVFHNNFFKINYNRSLLNKVFLIETLGLPKIKKEILLKAGASTIPDLNHKDFYSISINFPSLEEQTKIATFLSAVDSKITSLERLVSHWQAYKKGIMQQIFTQQLRFKAPNNQPFPEWETKLLGDICDVRDGTHDSPKYVERGFPFITSKNLSNGKIDFTDVNYITEEDFNNYNKRSLVSLGDILFGMIGTIGNPVLVTKAGFAIKNVALIKEKNKILNTFLLHQLNSSLILKQFHIENVGGTQKFLSLSTIRNLSISLPSKEEQTKIATFLSSLDDKIAHLQQQLTSYRQFKKALLQQMFV